MNDNEIIEQIFNNKLTTISQRIGAGHVNRVYMVTQKDLKFIVRLNEDNELPRFQKEAWCMQMAQKSGVISPNLISFGKIKNIAYMVTNFIEGKNAQEISDNKESIWKTLGTYAQKVNSISTTGFGENMTNPGYFSDSWNNFLKYNISSLNQNDKLLSMNVLNLKQQSFVKAKFEKLSQTKFNFGLIHGDLSFDNIILNDKVALIDWGCSRSDIVPHMEIIELLRNQISEGSVLFKSFLDGYGISAMDFELIKPDINSLSLLQAVDKLRWAIDRSPKKIDEFIQRVKTILSEY